MKIFTKQFVRRYLHELKTEYRFFYDDINEYGNRDSKKVIYFVPGLNGVPGQCRFAIPAIFHKFGRDIYVKGLHLDEFSSTKPVWEKFTIENVIKKKNQIIKDIKELAKKHEEVIVVCSSNGFYDFLYANESLSKSLKAKLKLVWVAVAPDKFDPSPWEKIFYSINGFKKNGYKWFAYPNKNILKPFNPEASMKYDWFFNKRSKKFNKHDIEVRFRKFGFDWIYSSLDCLNDMLNHIRKNTSKKIDFPAYVLAATNDGYWQGKNKKEITKLLDKYLINKKVIYKHTSHLWVLTPNNVSELFDLF